MKWDSHRRELDFSNAKYWFRRVGEHPVFIPLLDESRRIVSQSADADERLRRLTRCVTWDPFAFVDGCESAVAGKSKSDQLYRTLAQLEWQLLFDYCYRQAIGR